MAEEGLSYTIKFIPDVTEIDKSIVDISTRVSKAIKDSIEKARLEAGDVGPAAVGTGAPAGGVIDRIFSEFKSLKERVTSTLKEFNILSGRSRALGHPSSATIGSVTALAAQKIATGDPSKLSTDQALQLLASVAVAGGRAITAPQLYTGLTKEESIERMMQEQVGSLKGIIDTVMGVKEFMSMKGTAAQMRHADFYERDISAVGGARVKETEQSLMRSIGHGPIQDIMKAMMARDLPSAEWEETGMKYSKFAQELGMSAAEAKALSYSNKEVADVVRKVGNIIQVGEAKTVSDMPKFVRDIMNIVDVFKQADISRAAAKPPLPPLDLTVQAKMYAGATQGTPERELGLIKEQTEGGVIESIEFEDIGDTVRAVFIREFQENLPALQSELETLMVDMAPSNARTHVEHLLSQIEPLLGVLEARSLPKFWMDIGVDRWIRKSAIAYVGALKGEITPRLYQATKEEVGFGVSPDEELEVTTGRPRSDSELILGKLDIMDGKLDDIKSDLPQGSGTISGTLLGAMKDVSKGD